VRYSERFHYSVSAGDGWVRARVAIPGLEQTWEHPFSGTTLELELNAVAPDPDDFALVTSDLVELVAVIDGARTVLAAPDGRYLSAEAAESFTGRVIGVFATEGEIAVDWFDYEGSDD
jgi:xylan 1,4-beta-xylosidase